MSEASTSANVTVVPVAWSSFCEDSEDSVVAAVSAEHIEFAVVESSLASSRRSRIGEFVCDLRVGGVVAAVGSG